MPRHHKLLAFCCCLFGSVAQASQSLSAGSGAGTFPIARPSRIYRAFASNSECMGLGPFPRFS